MKKGIHIDANDDPMLLPEKIMEFAKQLGWRGEVVKLEHLGESKGKNITDYLGGKQQAEEYLNLEKSDGGKLLWRSNSSATVWGLTDPNDDSPLDEKAQEIQFRSIYNKDNPQAPIQQTNEPS